MLKNVVVLSAVCFALPSLLPAAPSSVYGRALQKARSVTAQAEKSRALPEEKKPEEKKPEEKKPEEKKTEAAPRKAPDALTRAQEFSRAVAAAGLKKYPPSGARGVNELLAQKIVTCAQLQLEEGKSSVSEKDLSIAWFGTEAALAGDKKGFPLFVTKPARGAVIAGFPDGSVRRLANRPRGVAGVISILKAESPSSGDPLWESYRKTARSIDRASR